MTRTFSTATGAVLAALAAAAFMISYGLALADSATTADFEAPAYATSTALHGQDGWSSAGAAGSGCAVYDHAVSESFGVPGFGAQSLRISNAVTSGCFGDQTFSKSLTDEAGETGAATSSYSGGTRQSRFEAEFSIRPMQLAQQPGLFMSVSPDRGDGARMSYLGFRDEPGGITVNFYDVQGVNIGFQAANFVETVVATGLSRAVTHTAKFVIDFVDGPSNDVVKIYLDGALVHTGTTWENYFRYDTESNPSLIDESRAVDSLLFRTGGTAAPATLGRGYLIDNVSLSSSASVPPPPPVTVTIVKYIDGAHADALSAGGLSFPMDASWSAANIGSGSGSFALSTAGFNNPNPYEATTVSMTSGADYAVSENTGGANVGASCADGKPFALLGYTVGGTLPAAAAGTLATTSPALSGITADQFIIVWNHACPPPPPPPPPANACATPSVAPAGYTLQNGTVGNDTVTIAPFTMFVGNGGNDIVSGPASGNYIVCTASGNDTVTLGNGDFTIDAGNGNNIITTGNGAGSVTTAQATDKITTGNGVQTINAGNGNNTILTGDGNKTVTTGNANDKITTGAGADVINAGGGINTVKSGAGNDTVTTGASNDNIDGGADTDTCNAGGGLNTLANCEL